MKLSDLWPRAATDSTTVDAADPAPTGRVRLSRLEPKPLKFPSTLAECRLVEEKLGRQVIRLEANILVSEDDREDETWGYRARAALKHMNRDRQALMIHMKKLRIEERKKDPIWNTYEKLLVRFLTERVPREVIDECVALAKAEVYQMRVAQAAEGEARS